MARKRLDRAQTAALAGRYALVATEELTVKNMTHSASGTVQEPGSRVAQKAGLNREILDTTPGLFTSLFRCKVLETGGEWRVASGEWRVAGRSNKKAQAQSALPSVLDAAKENARAAHDCCAHCGHKETRDTASARVVLRWALESISGQELAERGIYATRETPSFALHRLE